MYFTCSYLSPIGLLYLESDGECLTGLYLAEGRQAGSDAVRGRCCAGVNGKGPAPTGAIPEILRQAAEWLNRYFAGEKPLPGELPLRPAGSDFQKEVCRKLCEIPYGALATYGEIAASFAEDHAHKRMSAQAVGGAVGRNPISIIIPCHRVIGSGGNLTGYGGGLRNKLWLLRHEGVDTEKLRLPAHLPSWDHSLQG